MKPIEKQTKRIAKSRIKPTKSKKVKAWAFMFDSHNRKSKFFVTDGEFKQEIIYLKKPPAQRNPFTLREGCWKPTELEIIIKIN